MFCKNCGEKIHKGDIFCPNCGEIIIQPKTQTKTQKYQFTENTEYINKKRNTPKPPRRQTPPPKPIQDKFTQKPPQQHPPIRQRPSSKFYQAPPQQHPQHPPIRPKPPKAPQELYRQYQKPQEESVGKKLTPENELNKYIESDVVIAGALFILIILAILSRFLGTLALWISFGIGIIYVLIATKKKSTLLISIPLTIIVSAVLSALFAI